MMPFWSIAATSSQVTMIVVEEMTVAWTFSGDAAGSVDKIYI